ncbi:non-canonical purine NTP pyrophosphatase [Microbacterium sp.]|uniref:non-canonical purine NTP pyrophosphatase n=1 Tax=Microbacterium sp. TaxID=51671 RepID=UPI003C7869D9
MSTVEAYFATTSNVKLEEAAYCLGGHGISVQKLDPGELPEVLSLDLERVSREKALYAFRQLRVPLFCEHGSLAIEALKGLPGSLSRVFYDALGDEICELLPAGKPRTAVASAAVTYCDGRRIQTFVGEIRGEVPSTGRGARNYYYDRVFVPEAGARTFAEMSLGEKLDHSHIRIAYDKLGAHLTNAK